MTNEHLHTQLTQKFNSEVFDFTESYGTLSVTTTKEHALKVIQFLHDELHFQFLTDLCGIHLPEQKGAELGVVYHLHNMAEKSRVRIKVFVDEQKPEVYTATALFAAANWMERETYDFFGIKFIGHPNLKRILNVEEMHYFPLRKHYPLEDQTRIDKDDQMFGR